MQVVHLVNGPNPVNLLGNGDSDVVWRAWRDNNNAHGADYFTFYAADTAREDAGWWQLVPIFPTTKPTPELDIYRTDNGADCVLADLRLLRSRSSPKTAAVLVTAERDFGESFADSRPVTFVVYDLTARGEAEDGPRFYFKAVHRLRSKQSFCDVDEAFRQVLGIAPDSA
jgi:hypothetical protein